MKEKNNNNTSWDTLTKVQKANINLSSQQLNEGKGISIKQAMAQLAKKYNIPQKAK